MFYSILFLFLLEFLSSFGLNASDHVQLDTMKGYDHPLAWKQYPKSDYGYKPTLLECFKTKTHFTQQICSSRPSCPKLPWDYPSRKLRNCLRSESVCLEKAKRCDELINCGYGYPESFDNRVLCPYTTTNTGFIPKACLPKGYIGSKGRHYCDRKCTGETRICYYRLSIETTEAHSPHYCSEQCRRDKNCPDEKCIRLDGERTVITVYNHMFPGPTIAVCTGDTIVVDLVNHLSDFTQTFISDKAIEKNLRDDMRIYKVKDGEREAAKIAQEIFQRHVHHQHYAQRNATFSADAQPMSIAAATTGESIVVPDYKTPGEDTTCHWHGALMEATPQSDGPPGVTQNGVPYGCVYRYRFRFLHPGTFFYHSHTGMQRSLGAFGPLQVRSHHKPHCKLYDYDFSKHMLICTDFGVNRSHNLDVLLINSHGCNPRKNGTGYITTLNFKPNKRYLVRFCFNGITNTKIKCYVDGLKFLMIAADGHPIKPVWVDSFVLANGERVHGVFHFDVIPRNYIVHCFPLRNATLHQFAVFHVKGAPPPPTCKELKPIPAPIGIEYNTENAVPGTNGTITSSELQGLLNVHPLCCHEKKAEQIFVEMTISGRGIQINGITDEMPQEAYLCQYYNRGYINTTNMCDAESLKAKGIDCFAPNVTCRCNHIIRVKEGICVEYIALGSHPLHLHGYAYDVVAQGKSLDNGTMTKEKFLQYDRDGLIKRNLENPAKKDTVTVPANGYAVLRFATTNPGFWKTHCHIELHGVSGMSFALWVQSKNEIIKKRIRNHVCEPFQNNVCTGGYIKVGDPKENSYEY